MRLALGLILILVGIGIFLLGPVLFREWFKRTPQNVKSGLLWLNPMLVLVGIWVIFEPPDVLVIVGMVSMCILGVRNLLKRAVLPEYHQVKTE